MPKIRIYQLLPGYDTEIKPFLDYPLFADIPDERRTSGYALNWLMAMHTTDEKSLIEHFLQIPKDLYDYELLEFSVRHDALALKDIEPTTTAKYQDLCALAFVQDPLAPAWFHEDYRTAETVELMIKQPVFAMKPAKFSKSFEAIPWIEGVMTPELFNKASKASFEFMKMRPLSEASESALESHFLHGFEGYSQARKAGRLDLSAQFIRNGHWPQAYDSFNEVIEMPNTLNAALDQALACVNLDFGLCSLYLSFVKAHPIEDVVALATTRNHVKLVMELYTEAELRPMMSTNRHLKAGLLETAMGL